MKVCVCGSRSVDDFNWVSKILDEQLGGHSNLVLLSGGAKGADRLAVKWAKNRGIPVKFFLPQWDKYGRKAGLVRNKQMVMEADLIVALWDGVSTGTAHTAVTAHEVGKPVRVFINPVRGYSVWTELGQADAICVTTNGFYRTVNGKPKAVMGRGVAYQSKVFMPDAEYRLGKLLSERGNHVGIIGHINGTAIVAFPVKGVKAKYPCPVVQHAAKKFQNGQTVPGFLLKADLSLIKRSSDELAELIESQKWHRVVLPKPGCGAGELAWEDVLQHAILPSRLAQSPVTQSVHIADLTGSVALQSFVTRASSKKNPRISR